jgi:ornithine carbamoyltransferase
MERHSDLDTPISNLAELLSIVERRPDDMYITSMKQYIVNPLAWLITERMVRAANTKEKTGASPNSAIDAIATVRKLHKLYGEPWVGMSFDKSLEYIEQQLQ